ncbi:ankyrin repeat domain-containing protein [Streptomyces nodosus]|uniref:ankyrin repeat domain-containing protein n=1 Tax=Streptomyces nodosus TaxID=40318 RepID=UPI0036E6F81D
MTPRPVPAAFPRDEQSSWRRIRRHAVPRWMIEQSERRRRAGDWAGACAVCLVDVTFTLEDISRTHGGQVAVRLEEDLRHLVPDLVRWHLPRALGGRTTLATARTVVLAEYGTNDAQLHLTTPAMTKGPQRVSLRFGKPRPGTGPYRSAPGAEDWTVARHLWDARYAHELRERCGGGPDRAPFFLPDGTLRDPARLPVEDPGPDDIAARTEWITLLRERDGVEAGFAAAGIGLDLAPVKINKWHEREPLPIVERLALDLAGLDRELRRITARTGDERWLVAGDWSSVVLLERGGPGGHLKARVVGRAGTEGTPALAQGVWRRLPDLDLLRVGGVEPAQLHPLVAASLFPRLPVGEGPVGPPGPDVPQPARVRCRDAAWHQLTVREGRLDMPHTEEEQRREQAMRAFGGAVTGCFAVQQAWRSGEGRLPKALRLQRQELFQCVEHGDTPSVLALLDAGMDPHIRDARGRTLLHVLHLLDHEALLPRLLKAGLGLEAKDRQGRTPLYSVVQDGGSRALVEALLTAGARIDVVAPVDAYSKMDLSLAQTIRRYKRTDLDFLAQRVRAEHPGVGDEWWDEYHDAYVDADEDEDADEGESPEDENQ